MPFSHTKSSTAPIDLFGTFMKGFVAHKAFLHALSYKTPVIQTMGDGEEGGLGKASHFINKQSETPRGFQNAPTSLEEAQRFAFLHPVLFSEYHLGCAMHKSFARLFQSSAYLGLCPSQRDWFPSIFLDKND